MKQLEMLKPNTAIQNIKDVELFDRYVRERRKNYQ